MNDDDEIGRLLLPFEISVLQLVNKTSEHDRIFGILLKYNGAVFSACLPSQDYNEWVIALDVQLEPLKVGRMNTRANILKALREDFPRNQFRKLSEPDLFKGLFLFGLTFCANDYLNQYGGDGTDAEKAKFALDKVKDADPNKVISHFYELVFDEPLPYCFEASGFLQDYRI